MVFRELSVIEVKEIWHGQRAQLRGPVRARLRSVLARRFARDLLACPAATLDLSAILDGGMLIARRPSGQIGEDTARLVTAAVRAVGRRHPPAYRPSSAVTPRSSSTSAAASCTWRSGWTRRSPKPAGYRVSLVLVHQHLAQLPPTSGTCRDQRPQQDLFHLSPADAHHLARHTAPRVRRRGPRGPARVSRHRACAAPWPGRAVVLDRHPPAAGTISGAGRADPAPPPASTPASPSPGVATPDNTTTHRRRQRHRPWPWPGSRRGDRRTPATVR